MNYFLGLTLTGLITGIFAGFIGGGAEILIVPLLTFFGVLASLKSRIATSLIMLLHFLLRNQIYKYNLALL